MVLLRGRLKLGEEAQVVFGEGADIWGARHNHGEAIESEAEGEAGEFFGVVSGVVAVEVNGVKDGRIDHSAASDFEPAISGA